MARIFISSVETHLFSAAPAAGNRRRGRIGDSIRTSAAASGTLLPNDIDLQKGIMNVQTILHQHRRNARQMMVAVDNLKRLCIDHYFEEEVNNVIGACMHLLHSDDLFDATLALRLLREAGHEVSADDILRKFTDGCGGEFSLDISKDIRGLLSLHDMSYLNIGGESSLYKAKQVSRKNLTSAIRYIEPSLAKYVRQSLDHPYHQSLMQYKARHHLSYMQSMPNKSTATMEKLAIAEFQLNKQLHQNELQEIKRWWIDLGLAHEIPVIRDQVPKWYMWAMTILQGSSFSKYRVQVAKIISFVYVVDDIFDLVGTTHELSCFTDAIKMWDIAASDSLPTYMRSCYKAIYNVTNEIADMTIQEHGFNPTNHLKKAWAMLFDGFMMEAKWLATDQVPVSEDYLNNGVITSGVPLLFAHIFVLLGHDDTTSNDAEKVISSPAKILRLYDDMGSAKDEAQEGLDGSYKEFYLMENPSCTPTDAEEHMLSMITTEWEKLNKEYFKGGSFPSSFTQACLNSVRMVSVMYGYNKEQRLPVLEDYMKTLLL